MNDSCLTFRNIPKESESFADHSVNLRFIYDFWLEMPCCVTELPKMTLLARNLIQNHAIERPIGETFRKLLKCFGKFRKQ